MPDDGDKYLEYPEWSERIWRERMRELHTARVRGEPPFDDYCDPPEKAGNERERG